MLPLASLLPASLPPNLLGPPMPWSPHVPGWGTPDNVYSLGLFRLESDEALVIERVAFGDLVFAAFLFAAFCAGDGIGEEEETEIGVGENL